MGEGLTHAPDEAREASHHIEPSITDEGIKVMLRDSKPGDILIVADVETRRRIEVLAGQGYEDIIIRIETPQ